MSWLLFKRCQEQALIKEVPYIEMSNEDYIELMDYCGDRFGFFQDLLKDLKEKKVFMQKEIKFSNE